MFLRKFAYLSKSLLLLLSIINASAQTFIHAGILHSNEDLQRMKEAVANKQEPIYSGYQLFIQNPASQFTYKIQGSLAMVGRNEDTSAGEWKKPGTHSIRNWNAGRMFSHCMETGTQFVR